METLIKELMNHMTVAVMEEFDEYGNSYTRILEGGKTFVVKFNLKKIFEDTLNFYLTTFEGATRGAKSILGEKYHPPILINAEKGIIMIPCGPIGRKNSIWIAYNHIRHLERHGRTTIIYTSYGHQITVPLTISQVEMKMGQAARLQTTHIYRTKSDMSFYYEKEKRIILRMKTGKRNMSVEEITEE